MTNNNKIFKADIDSILKCPICHNEREIYDIKYITAICKTYTYKCMECKEIFRLQFFKRKKDKRITKQSK